MATAVKLRTDYSAVALRRLAKETKDVNQSRRLVSLAAVLDGMSRADATLNLTDGVIAEAGAEAGPGRPVSERCDRLQCAVEHVAFFVLQCRFAKASDPVGGVLAAPDKFQAREHTIEFRLSSRMRVAVAFDQATAFEDFDGERVVGRDMIERQPIPAFEMPGLHLVAKQHAAPAAQATDEPEGGEAGKAVGADPATVIDAPVEPAGQLRPTLD